MGISRRLSSSESYFHDFGISKMSFVSFEPFVPGLVNQIFVKLWRHTSYSPQNCLDKALKDCIAQT